MFIDIHVHCCKPRHPKITRMGGSHYPSPERLIEMMDENGIDMACMMVTLSPEWRYTMVSVEEIVEICAMYPKRLVPFCNMDPRYLTNDETADFTPLLEGYKELGCKGVGECIPNLPFDDPMCMNFFKHVEKSGLPLTIHVAPQKGSFYGFIDEVGLPRMEKVLQTFPDLIILGHSQPFWAEISTDVIQDGERARYPKGPVTPGRLVDLFRKYPNLYGDLSAGSGHNAISRDPEFGYQFMEEFQDRLCWGTDIARSEQELMQVAYFKKLKDEKLISDDAFEKITWKNANRVLKLGLPE